LCGYCPVRKVARDGQHSELETKLLANVVPRWPRRARVFGSARISSSLWSSVMMTRMFGRAATAAEAGAGTGSREAGKRSAAAARTIQCRALMLSIVAAGGFWSRLGA
jgi:hypothetical protein